MRYLLASVLCLAASIAPAQPGITFPAPRPQPGVAVVVAQPDPAPAPADPFGRGLVPPKDLAHRQKLSYARQGLRLAGLPKATEAEWDSRDKGWVPPPRNQGQCGSCWDFAAVRVCEIAACKAGKGVAAAVDWSEQAVLNCGRNGGCNGDWPETALEQVRNAGIPNEKDVPYTARAGNCNANAPRTNTIDDYGYVGPEEGVAPVQAIKDAIKAYGAVAVAVAADNSFSNWRAGIFPGSGATGINHAVVLVGWKDGGAGGGYWVLSNSWGGDWCEGGYIRIRYGANQVGYGAMYAVVADAPSPTPPVPPGPTPPVPPAPAAGFTGTLTYENGVLKAVTPGGKAADGLEAELKSAGVSPAIIADVMKLIADVKGKAAPAVIMADVLKLFMDLQVPVNAGSAPPACCGGGDPMSVLWRRETVSRRGAAVLAA